MLNLKKTIILCLSFIVCSFSYAQLEIAHLSTKNFSAIGFGGFLNVSIPVSDASYITAEAGLYVFSHSEHNVALLPVLAGYRYTLNGTGTGLYVEPNAGYSFGGSDIQKYGPNGFPVYDANGNEVDQKVTGATAGLDFGYLFEPTGRIQFNISLRYEHVFSEAGQNMFSLRIAHAFTFGRRE
jgi:hypothetical protein